jgi:hypothetical protein
MDCVILAGNRILFIGERPLNGVELILYSRIPWLCHHGSSCKRIGPVCRACGALAGESREVQAAVGSATGTEQTARVPDTGVLPGILNGPQGYEDLKFGS